MKVDRILDVNGTNTKILETVYFLKHGDSNTESDLDFRYRKARRDVKEKLAVRKDYDYECIYDAVGYRFLGFGKAVLVTKGLINLFDDDRIDLINIIDPYIIASIIIMDDYMNLESPLLDVQAFEYVIACITSKLEKVIEDEIEKIQ